MSLSERLSATNSAEQFASVPASWQPSVTYNPGGATDVVALGVGEPSGEDDWADDVRALGVSIPDGFVVRLVEIRHDPSAWVRHAQGEDAVSQAVTRRRYVVEPARTVADVDELVKAIGKRRPKAVANTNDFAYVHAIADWQIGKIAYGAGTSQTVDVIMEALDKSVARVKKHKPDTLLLAALGDLCEGVVSQKGATVLASDMGLTEQLRVVRRLLLEHVKVLAPLVNRLVLVSVPGNHDEPHRLMGGRARADDSFAVDAAVQVADALALAGGFDNVEVVLPDVDDLTVTVEVAGSIVAAVHGHQARPGKAHEWWAKQSHARHRVSAADILLSGHYHHLQVTEDAGRTFMQAPTVDPGSPWWDQKHGGKPGPSGVLTFFTEGGAWWNLRTI